MKPHLPLSLRYALQSACYSAAACTLAYIAYEAWQGHSSGYGGYTSAPIPHQKMAMTGGMSLTDRGADPVLSESSSWSYTRRVRAAASAETDDTVSFASASALISSQPVSTTEYTENATVASGEISLSSAVGDTNSLGASSLGLALLSAANTYPNGSYTRSGQSSSLCYNTDKIWSGYKLILFENNEYSTSSSIYALGGAIYAINGSTLSFENNGTITLCENSVSATGSASSAYARGGAIYYTHTLSFTENESINFSGNSATSSSSYAEGGAIYAYSTLSFTNNIDISFSGNSATSSSSYAEGGAIYASSGSTLSFIDNGAITFNGNSVSGSSDGDGGAIYVYSTLSFTKNGTIAFSGNNATSSSSSAGGGAICTKSNSTLSFANNVVITFNGNSAKSSSHNSGAYGGAIYAGSSSTLSFTENDAITFSENNVGATMTDGSTYAHGGAIEASSGSKLSFTKNGTITFSRNKNSATGTYFAAEACGGAIYAYASGSSSSTLSFTDNGDISFCGNRVSATSTNSSSVAYGGAIYEERITLNFTNNTDITFSGNSVNASSYAYGGAIYAYNSTLRIQGSALFEKNAEILNDGYRLRSIYQRLGTLELSAPTGKTIEFHDSIISAASAVVLNLDYTKSDGTTQTADGTILFTGAYTAADLAEVKGCAGTASELADSLSSKITGKVQFMGGTLAVEDGAILTVGGLTTTKNANATLSLKDGTLNAGSGDITFTEGSRLTTEGTSSLSFGTLTLTESITNSGTLSLSGSIDASGLSVEQKDIYVDVSNQAGVNGFAAGKGDVVIIVDGGTVVDMGVSITHSGFATGQTLTLGSDGVARCGLSDDVSIDYSNYLLMNGSVAVSDIHAVQGAASATITQKGGALTVDDDAEVYSSAGQIVLSRASLSGEISGEVSLISSGIAAISGINTYSGGTTVAAGTLNVTVDSALGTGFVVLNGTLGLGDVTLANTISGTGAIIKTGSGTSMLSGCNTYSGGTTISGGTLTLGHAQALGTGIITMTGGALNTSGYSIANEVIASGTVSVTGAVKTLTFTGGTLSGALSGSTKLIVSGNTTLDGNNTYSGGTTISGGSLTLGHAQTLGTGEVTMAGGTLDMNGQQVSNALCVTGEAFLQGASAYTGTITVNGGTLAADNAKAFGTGAIELISGTLDLGDWAVSNKISATGGHLEATAAKSQLTVNGELTLGKSTKLGSIILSGGTLSGGSISNTTMALRAGEVASAITGSSVLAKTTTGTVTLSGENTHSGATTVSAGTLQVTGSVLNSTVKVNKGATLMADGRVDHLSVAEGASVLVGAENALTHAEVIMAGGSLSFDTDSGISSLNVSGATTLNALSGVTVSLGSAISSSAALSISGGVWDLSALEGTRDASTRVNVSGETGASGFLKFGDYHVSFINGGSLTMNGTQLLYKGSTLTLGTDGIAHGGSAVDGSNYLLLDGDAVSSLAVHAVSSAATITQTGGELTVNDAVSVNTTGGDIMLTGGELSGSISGASISASVGSLIAALSGTNSLTADNWAITEAITNSGTLSLSGNINADALALYSESATHVSVNGQSGADGFAKSAYYELTLVSGGVVENTGVTVSHQALPSELVLTLGNDGVAKAGGVVDESDYLLASGNTTVSDIHAVSSAATISQTGGTLTVNDAVSVNTTGGNIALTGGDLSGSISGASISVRAGSLSAVLSGTNSLTADTWAITEAITNSGTLSLSGSINTDALELHRTDACYINTAGEVATSGFTKSACFELQVVNGGTVENKGVNLTHSSLPEPLTLVIGNNGVAIAGGVVDYGSYYLTGSDTASLTAIHGISSSAWVNMSGGTLTVEAGDAGLLQATGGHIILSGGELSSVLSGTTTLTIAGDSTLSGEQLHSGNTVVQSGTLTLAGSLQNSALVITENGSLDLNLQGAHTMQDGERVALLGGTVTGGDWETTDGATLTLQGGTFAGMLFFGGGVVEMSGNTPVTVNDLCMTTAKTTLRFSGYKASETPYELLYSGSLAVDTENDFIIENGSDMRAQYTLSTNDDVDALLLTVAECGQNTALSWKADSGIWAVRGESEWNFIEADDETDNRFYNGDAVSFTTGGEVTIEGTVKPRDIVVSGAEELTFTGGGSIAGASTLEKSGSGTLRIETANSYTGGTTISGGTVEAANADALGSGAVDVQGGTLAVDVQKLHEQVSVGQNGALAFGSAEDARGTMTASSTSGFTLGAGTVGYDSATDTAMLSGTDDGALVLDNVLVDMAAGSTLKLENVVLAASAQLTDDTATLQADGLTVQVAASNAVLSAPQTMTATSLTVSGHTPPSAGEPTWYPKEGSTVRTLTLNNISNYTITGSSLSFDLSGYSALADATSENYVGIVFETATMDLSNLTVTATMNGKDYTAYYDSTQPNGTAYFDLTAATVPEPATTALSLLALAGLAARRRRK